MARKKRRVNQKERFAAYLRKMQKDCPHYLDNQGFCHRCGILMDEALARQTGFFREGMKEGESGF